MEDVIISQRQYNYSQVASFNPERGLLRFKEVSVKEKNFFDLNIIFLNQIKFVLI